MKKQKKSTEADRRKASLLERLEDMGKRVGVLRRSLQADLHELPGWDEGPYGLAHLSSVVGALRELIELESELECAFDEAKEL